MKSPFFLQRKVGYSKLQFMRWSLNYKLCVRNFLTAIIIITDFFF